MKPKPFDRGNSIMTYEDKAGNLTVTHHGKWLPGIYDSPEAAVCAARRDYSALNDLWKQKKAKGDYLMRWKEVDNLPPTLIILS